MNGEDGVVAASAMCHCVWHSGAARCCLRQFGLEVSGGVDLDVAVGADFVVVVGVVVRDSGGVFSGVGIVFGVGCFVVDDGRTRIVFLVIGSVGVDVSVGVGAAASIATVLIYFSLSASGSVGAVLLLVAKRSFENNDSSTG